MSNDNNAGGSSNNNGDNTNTDNQNTASDEEIKKIAEAMVNERLKELKAKLDGAYAARDESQRELTRLKEEARVKEMEQLTQAGKHQEVLQLKLTAAEEQLAIMKEKLTAHERDNALRTEMAGLKFRNERAAAMAYQTMIGQLVQDSNGVWVHRTGANLKDFVASFKKDPENDFLLAPEINSGSGATSGTSGKGKLTGKDILGMSSADLLAAAQEGRLGSISV